MKESVEQVDENQDIKATAPKEKPTKVGQQATTPSDIGRKYPDNKWVVKKNTGTSKAYRPLVWVAESVEQVDENYRQIGRKIEDYAKKKGGIDKNDMLKVASMLQKGDKKGAIKFAKRLDTDPRDMLLGMMNESVEHLDEIVAKQNKNGEIEMTKAKYAKVHKDFKGKWPDGVHYVTQHQGRQGMTQVPVKFVKEEVEVDVTELWEADYKLQHNTFLGAIREAYTIAEQNGFTVDEDDWTNKIMHGPMKPSNGEINNYSIGLLENNKVVGNQLLIRVSNIGKTYELTAHVQ
jgi:hypothetical protein